jgi:soluble lytic murein transglycosylase-like protein
LCGITRANEGTNLTIANRGQASSLRGGILSGTRLLVLCAAFCVSFPADSSADLGNDGTLAPKAAAFAYRASHAMVDSLYVDDVATGSAQAGPIEPKAETQSSAAGGGERAAPRAFSRRELCHAAVSVAQANNLPVPFFANLIQQESGFQPHVVSPAGAQGIAQFMPRVAAAYGLTNPFDPIHALTVAGKFLAELVAQFGNLGLAAAAYNAGPQRVKDWIAKRRKLPAETRDYVRNITGRPAEQWARAAKPIAELPVPPRARCLDGGTMLAEAGERARSALARSRPDAGATHQVRGPGKRRAAVAARSRGNSAFAAGGAAAKRFAAWQAPALIAPEPRSERARASRRRPVANVKAAKAFVRRRGPAPSAHRVRMATAH